MHTQKASPCSTVRKSSGRKRRQRRRWYTSATVSAKTFSEGNTGQMLIFQVRNYYYYGKGSVMADQDLAAYLAEYGLSPESAAEGISLESARTESCELRPFVCRYSEGCAGCGVTEDFDSTSMYTILPSDEHIRLLEILPGTRGPVKCRLHTALLPEDQHTYEALSYTWEIDTPPPSGKRRVNQEATRPIVECNGAEIEVGINLAAALWTLRREREPRMVWADAVCINQEDTPERSHQVSRMSAIFKSAFQVLIWLGDHFYQDRILEIKGPVHHRPSHLAFSGICELVNDWREKSGLVGAIPAATHSPSLEPPHEDPCCEPPTANSDLWGTILDLFKCRWFSRVWVIQEVALARAATVIWGRSEIPWEVVGLAASIIRTNYSRISASMRTPHAHYSPPNRQVPTGIANAYFIYRLCRSQSYSKPLEFNFFHLLKLTRQFSCHDDRDRIYGLLGLPTTDRVSGEIVPDYTKSRAEIYLDVARKIIGNSNSIALLSSCQMNETNGYCYMNWYNNPRQEGYDESISSWVPQWHFLLTPSLTSCHRGTKSAASRNHSAQLKSSDDPRKLILRGRIVDKLSLIKYPNWQEFWRGSESADATMGVPNFGKRNKTHGVHRVAQLLHEGNFTRSDLEHRALTLTAGKNWYGLPVSHLSAHLADYARCLVKEGLLWSLSDGAFGSRPNEWGQWTLEQPDEGSDSQFEEEALTQVAALPESGEWVTFEELETLSKGGGNADRFLDAAATACQRRARFTLESGLIGIGPEATDHGDLVCLLYGADTPFVIREQGGGYRLIGECYIRDLTEGIQKLSDPDIKLPGMEEWIELI